MIKNRYNYFKTLKEAQRFAEKKRRKFHRAKVKRFEYKDKNKVEYAVIWEEKSVKQKR